MAVLLFTPSVHPRGRGRPCNDTETFVGMDSHASYSCPIAQDGYVSLLKSVMENLFAQTRPPIRLASPRPAAPRCIPPHPAARRLSSIVRHSILGPPLHSGGWKRVGRIALPTACCSERKARRPAPRSLDAITRSAVLLFRCRGWCVDFTAAYPFVYQCVEFFLVLVLERCA